MPPNNPFFSQPDQNGQFPTTPVAVDPQMMQIPNQQFPQQQAPMQQPIPVAPAQQQAVPQGQQGPAKIAPRNPNSTQSTLQLSEIREGMVIMLDGSFRAVISCMSINFDLMSEREREGIEYSYQNFLNSLNFPVQILVRSRRVDIGPYMDKLIDIRRNQDNMLLGVLMDDYTNFIGALAEEANIMEKTFYIVVPFFPQGDIANLVDQGKGFFGKLFSKPKNTITRIDTAAYQKAKDEIKNRCDVVMSGLFQMGVQSIQLDTKALGELYYNSYNPDTAVRQPLADFNNTTSTYVKKGPGQQPGGIL